MFAFDNLAPKLLLSEILNAPVVETDSGPKLASHGIYYNRVQLQVRATLGKDSFLAAKNLNFDHVIKV